MARGDPDASALAGRALAYRAEADRLRAELAAERAAHAECRARLDLARSEAVAAGRAVWGGEIVRALQRDLATLDALREADERLARPIVERLPSHAVRRRAEVVCGTRRGDTPLSPWRAGMWLPTTPATMLVVGDVVGGTLERADILDGGTRDDLHDLRQWVLSLWGGP